MAKKRRRRKKQPTTTRWVVVLVLLGGVLAVAQVLPDGVLADLRDEILGEGGDVLGGPDDLPTPAAPDTPLPEPAGEGDEPLAVELGGFIDYGEVDEQTGQRTGITAVITPGMVEAANAEELGSSADSDIRPSGFDELPQRNRARGHLLGRQLGGSGDVEANLVAMFQQRANSPVMRDYENAIAEAVEAGETIRYVVTLLYDDPDDGGMPRVVRLRAEGDQGFRLDVEIDNTPEADVVEHVAPPEPAEPAETAEAAAGG